MSQESLENFGAYRLAMDLFDLVVSDMGNIERDVRTHRHIAQQVASADSICSNIEEGHGRETTKDYTHFLLMARGSACETRGRYLRMQQWLPADIVADCVRRCDAVLGILAKTFTTLSRGPATKRREAKSAPSVRVPLASSSSSPPVPPASTHS